MCVCVVCIRVRGVCVCDVHMWYMCVCAWWVCVCAWGVVCVHEGWRVRILCVSVRCVRVYPRRRTFKQSPITQLAKLSLCNGIGTEVTRAGVHCRCTHFSVLWVITDSCPGVLILESCSSLHARPLKRKRFHFYSNSNTRDLSFRNLTWGQCLILQSLPAPTSPCRRHSQ